MIRYIATFVVLTVLGVLYERYKLKYQSDEELSKYDLIKKYLLNGSDNLGGKPLLWIHAEHDVNARNWSSFYSRNNIKLNQPYLLFGLVPVYFLQVIITQFNSVWIRCRIKSIVWRYVCIFVKYVS